MAKGKRIRIAEAVMRLRVRIARARGRIPDYSSVMTVGDYTYGSENVVVHHWIGDATRLRIGRFCSIGDHVHVFLGGNHRTDWTSTYPFAAEPTLEYPRGEIAGVSPYSNGDVAIGNDVWIGSHVSIMSGVTVGDGAVIAAFSHVVQDVPPFQIVGGNPARCLRQRFDDQTVAALREIAWWDWPLERVLEHRDVLSGVPTTERLMRLRGRPPHPP